MALAVGTRLGSYEILAPIGAGGMGEVYRAKDTKLKRDVALKVLPEAFAADPERMARFQREAEVLASLNHPNIAQIYGVEERALVMELVEGESPRGPMQFDEAWKIASQIAAGLEYAHDKGIVHRDLKPANVKVTPDGVVKLLDFGLAKAFSAPTSASGSVDNSPTLTLGATQLGVILGTAAYMAPEQAKGKSVDKRADIWAFGVVLYELLTGERLFSGDDVSDTLAQVLTRQPDWERVPARARRLLRACLEKDPKLRLRDIGDARRLIDEEPPAPVATTSALDAPTPRPPWMWMAASALFCLIAAALALVHFREEPPEAVTTRFQIPSPEKISVNSAPFLSPDGRRLAFTGSTGAQSQIWVHSLDSLDDRALPGTEGAGTTDLFWSPDSRSIGFVANGKLRRIEASGGPPQTLCDASFFVGGTWNRSGMIVFASGTGGLSRVSQAGGAPALLAGTDPNTRRVFPQFLPDGNHLIYMSQSSNSEESGIYLTTVAGSPPKRLVGTTSRGAYAPPSSSGQKGDLLFIREGALMAQPLDPNTFELAGEPFPVAERVGANAAAAFYSVSFTGALAYRTGLIGGNSQLIWFDRTGKSLGTLGPPGQYNDVVLSPDGKRAAVTRSEGGFSADVWILDVARNIPTRFTFDPAADWDPVWSSDGRHVIFASLRGAPSVNRIFWKDSTGVGNEDLLLKSDAGQRPKGVSPDGKFLLFTQGNDLWVLPLTPGQERKPAPYLQSPYTESQGQFSPGVSGPRWIAYTSNESGPTQIYVQSFPIGAGKFQISTGGGLQPRWRRNGKELFYVSPDWKLMAVEVTTAPKFEAGIPKVLFQTQMRPGGGSTNVFRYDVTPDGQRFLIDSESGSGDSDSIPVTVVLNWQASLKK
jgi:eukaryotic-like serine/threonine-protein kinase